MCQEVCSWSVISNLSSDALNRDALDEPSREMISVTPQA